MATMENHVLWKDGSQIRARTNRQYVTDEIHREVGVRLYPASATDGVPWFVWPYVPAHEALDIDTPADLAAARQALSRRTVILEFVAGGAVGSGHLHRVLTLAEHLQHHDIGLLYTGTETWVNELIAQRRWPIANELSPPGVWITDTLDTDINHVAILRARGWKVVTLEDNGLGSRFADLTINALYPPTDQFWERHSDRIVTGADYAVLRPEFLGLPARQINERASRLLVTFGGTDPAGLTERIVGLMDGRAYPNLETRVITPPGRNGEPISMANEMLAADLVITSGGRTVYEAAATGTPAIILGQNYREGTHVHLGPKFGNVYLGLGGFVADSKILRTIDHLLETPDLRAEMSKAGRASVDGRGARRIAMRIESLLEEL